MKKGLTKKMQNNKQELVNENMEQMFQLPRGSTTVSERMKNIIKPEKTIEDISLKNNQNQAEAAVKVKKGRGGARANSGRKVGSTNKITASTLLAEIARQDVPFEQGLAEDYVRARQSGDMMLVQRYQQMFLSKVLADKQEVDMTSNGQTMGVAFNFPTNELPDWQNNEQTKH